MENERLWSAMVSSSATVDDLAEAAGVDPKTVQRWLHGRTPHRRHRIAAARKLRVDESFLWPDPHTGASAELLQVYPSRASIPRDTWMRLIDNACDRIDMLCFAGTFMVQNFPRIARTLAARAEAGVDIRLCFGDPTSEAVATRAREEAYTLAEKIRSALTYYRSLVGRHGCSIRLHNATVYASLFRYDEEMMINPHAYGEPASANPCFHVRQCPGGTLFDHYLGSFERVWGLSQPWLDES